MPVLIVALVLMVPAVAWAASTFKDVPDDHLFHDDIEWMAETGVTKGCNPPDNDKYCPSDDVTRGQMAAFIHRLETNGVFMSPDAPLAPLASFQLQPGKISNPDFRSPVTGVSSSWETNKYVVKFTGFSFDEGTDRAVCTPNTIAPHFATVKSSKGGDLHVYVSDKDGNAVNAKVHCVVYDS